MSGNEKDLEGGLMKLLISGVSPENKGVIELEDPFNEEEMKIILLLVSRSVYESFKHEIRPKYLDFYSRKINTYCRAWLRHKIDKKMSIKQIYQENNKRLDEQLDEYDIEDVKKVISEPELLPIWVLKFRNSSPRKENLLPILSLILIAITMRELYPKLKELEEN